MRVGIDLDGVVFDFVNALRAGWAMSPDNFPDPFKWEIWECWGMDKDEFLRQADEMYEQHLFFKGKPYEGAVEALHELNALGHTVHIVTARHHPVARRDTVAWLEEHGVRYDSLTFSDDKTCIPVDVFIEDNLPNAEACAKAGMKSFLMDRPWNQADTEVPRVITMFDFLAEVQHVQAQECQRRENQGEQQQLAFRTFETGATRDIDDSKLDFEGFFSPAVLKRFAEYMQANQTMADGSKRSSDNWQKGMPNESYVKSGWRHWHDVWSNHRGLETGVDQEEALCAVMFNAMGYLFNLLKEKDDA